MKRSAQKAMHAKSKLAKLSDLANVPYAVLEKQLESHTGDDKKKIQQAMNLGSMRRLSNNKRSMFGMKNY